MGIRRKHCQRWNITRLHSPRHWERCCGDSVVVRLAIDIHRRRERCRDRCQSCVCSTQREPGTLMFRTQLALERVTTTPDLDRQLLIERESAAWSRGSQPRAADVCSRRRSAQLNPDAGAGILDSTTLTDRALPSLTGRCGRRGYVVAHAGERLRGRAWQLLTGTAVTASWMKRSLHRCRPPGTCWRKRLS